MQQAFLGLVAAGMVLAVGCAQPDPQGETGTETDTEMAFKDLYREYSDRFHEKMVSQARQIQPMRITAEAARMWDDVFAGHVDLVRARQAELLEELPPADDFDESLYLEVFPSMDRPAEEVEAPEGLPLKQFLWSPRQAAQFYLQNWLGRRLDRREYQARSVLLANAGLSWEVIDGNPDRPELLQRQGPMIFIVGLKRINDYYVVRKLRWLRPEAWGEIQTQTPARPPVEPPKSGTPEAGAVPEEGAPPDRPEEDDTTPKG